MGTYSDTALLTTHQLGQLLQVDPSSVVKWTNDGRIPVFRTPGRHRRFKVADVRRFLAEAGMWIPAELGGGQFSVLFIAEAPQTARAIEKRGTASERMTFSVARGVAGLAQAGANPPALLIIDSELAVFEPLALIRDLRALAVFEHTTFALLVGPKDTQMSAAAAAAGVATLVHVPAVDAIEALLPAPKRRGRGVDPTRRSAKELISPGA